MVVRPWVVSYSAIDSFVGVASTLCTELPYGPVVSMLAIEEGYEAVKRVTVGSLGVCLAWSGTVRGGKLSLAGHVSE